MYSFVYEMEVRIGLKFPLEFQGVSESMSCKKHSKSEGTNVFANDMKYRELQK